MTKDYNDLFDGEDDDYLNGDMIETQSSPKAGANEDDDDDHMPTSSHLRRAIIDDDDNSLGTELTNFPGCFSAVVGMISGILYSDIFCLIFPEKSLLFYIFLTYIIS